MAFHLLSAPYTYSPVSQNLVNFIQVTQEEYSASINLDERVTMT